MNFISAQKGEKTPTNGNVVFTYQPEGSGPKYEITLVYKVDPETRKHSFRMDEEFPG